MKTRVIVKTGMLLLAAMAITGIVAGCEPFNHDHEDSRMDLTNGIHRTDEGFLHLGGDGDETRRTDGRVGGFP